MTAKEPTQDKATSIEAREPCLMPDLENIRKWREEFDQAERKKAEILQRLAKIRKLRRQLIGP